MNTQNISLFGALLLAAASLCQGQTGPAVPTQPTLLSNHIDTWIEGTVLTLDADGQKFTVRGVKLPHATVEAGMAAEIADRTKDLDAAARQAKIQEIRSEWADKLVKSKQQPVAASPSDFNFTLPDRANLVIMSEKAQGEAVSDPNHVIATVGVSGASSSGSASSGGGGHQAEQATAPADPKMDKNLTQNELTALRTLRDLKVGDKVKVGFDAGLLSNTAYVVLESAPVLR